MFISNFYHTDGTSLPQTTAWDSEACWESRVTEVKILTQSQVVSLHLVDFSWKKHNEALWTPHCCAIRLTGLSALLFPFFFTPIFLSEADQRPYLSVRQIINISVWTTKICHTNSSISMQFDFLLGEKLPRAGMVVPWCFTSALSQSNWFWSRI